MCKHFVPLEFFYTQRADVLRIINVYALGSKYRRELLRKVLREPLY